MTDQPPASAKPSVLHIIGDREVGLAMKAASGSPDEPSPYMEILAVPILGARQVESLVEKAQPAFGFHLAAHRPRSPNRQASPACGHAAASGFDRFWRALVYRATVFTPGDSRIVAYFPLHPTSTAMTWIEQSVQ
jgi:hypothetical protein